jgi:hypothetical protein
MVCVSRWSCPAFASESEHIVVLPAVVTGVVAENIRATVEAVRGRIAPRRVASGAFAEADATRSN